jgi:HEAT repeat protein
MKKSSFIFMLLFSGLGFADKIEPKKMSLATLFVQMQGPGHTAEQRRNKGLAHNELYARKGIGLDYLMSQIHMRNMWLRIYAYPLVLKLKAEEAVPVLLPYLDSAHALTRRYAAFYLGFYDTPEHAAKVRPLLTEKETVKAAVRTLGKWQDKVALPEVIQALKSEHEILRITAANALRDIGETEGARPLIEALEDEFFTVRKTAARALVALGEKAEPLVIEYLDKTEGKALRELIRILGEMKSKAAVEKLASFKAHAVSGVRNDAVFALEQINAE